MVPYFAQEVAKLKRDLRAQQKAILLAKEVKFEADFDLEKFKQAINLSQMEESLKEIQNFSRSIREKRNELIQAIKKEAASNSTPIILTDEEIFEFSAVKELTKTEMSLIERARTLSEYQAILSREVLEIEKMVIHKREVDPVWKAQIEGLVVAPVEGILSISGDVIDVGSKSMMLQRAISLQPSEFRRYLDYLYYDLKKDKKEMSETDLKLIKDLKAINDITWNNPYQESTSIFNDPNKQLITKRPILAKVLEPYEVSEEACRSFVKNKIIGEISRLEASIDQETLRQQQEARRQKEANFQSDLSWRTKPAINPDTQEPFILHSSRHNGPYQSTIAGHLITEFGEYIEWNVDNPGKSESIWYQDPNHVEDQKTLAEKYKIIRTGPNPNWEGGYISEFSLPLEIQRESPASINLAQPFQSTPELLDYQKQQEKVRNFEALQTVRTLYQQFRAVLKRSKEEQDKILDEISKLNRNQALYDLATARAELGQYDTSQDRKEALKQIISTLEKKSLYEYDEATLSALKAGVQKMQDCQERYDGSIVALAAAFNKFKTDVQAYTKDQGLNPRDIAIMEQFNELSSDTESALAFKGLAQRRYEKAILFLSDLEQAKIQYKKIEKEISDKFDEIKSSLEANNKRSEEVKAEYEKLMKEQKEAIEKLSVPASDFYHIIIRKQELEDRRKRMIALDEQSKLLSHEYVKIQLKFENDCEEILKSNGVQEFEFEKYEKLIKRFADQVTQYVPMPSEESYIEISNATQELIREAERKQKEKIEQTLKEQQQALFQGIVEQHKEIFNAKKKKLDALQSKMDDFIIEQASHNPNIDKVMLDQMKQRPNFPKQKLSKLEEVLKNLKKNQVQYIDLKNNAEKLKEMEALLIQQVELHKEMQNVPKAFPQDLDRLAKVENKYSEELVSNAGKSLENYMQPIMLSVVENLKNQQKLYNQSTSFQNEQIKKQKLILEKLDDITYRRSQLVTFGNNILQAVIDERNRVYHLGLEKNNKSYLDAIDDCIKDFSQYTSLDKIRKKEDEVLKAYNNFEASLNKHHAKMKSIPIYKGSFLNRLLDGIRSCIKRVTTKLKDIPEKFEGITEQHKTEFQKTFTSFKEKRKAEALQKAQEATPARPATPEEQANPQKPNF